MERGDPLRVAGMQPKIPPLLFHTTQTVPSVGLDLKSQLFFLWACYLHLNTDSRGLTGIDQKKRVPIPKLLVPTFLVSIPFFF